MVVLFLLGCPSLADPVAWAYGGCTAHVRQGDAVDPDVVRTVQYDLNGDVLRVDADDDGEVWAEESRYGAPHEASVTARYEAATGLETWWTYEWSGGDLLVAERAIHGREVDWRQTTTWEDHRALVQEIDTDGDGGADRTWTFTWTETETGWMSEAVAAPDLTAETATYDTELILLERVVEEADGTREQERRIGIQPTGDAELREVVRSRNGEVIVINEVTTTFDDAGRRTGVRDEYLYDNDSWAAVTTYTYSDCAR